MPVIPTKSEKIAYQWLLEQGYKEEEIITQTTKNPDFICGGIEHFEVKKILYDKSLRPYLSFTEAQMNGELKEDTVILVIDEKKEAIAHIFKFRDIREIIDYQIRPNPDMYTHNNYTKINNIQELDDLFSDTKQDRKWTRIIGFYNRVRWNGCQSLTDFLETATSLVKSLKKQGYQPTPHLLVELIDSYEEKNEVPEP